MKIALDLTPLRPIETGVDRFILNLVRGLSEVDHDNNYVLFINRGDQSRLPGLDRSRWKVIPVRTETIWQRLLFQQIEMPRRMKREGVGVLHSLAFLAPLWTPGLRQVLSVHDMTFFTRPDVHNRLRRSVWFRWLVARSIRRADHLIVPTRSVREDLLRLFTKRDPETLHVAKYGLDPRFRPRSPKAVTVVRQRLGLPQHYILFVGTLEPRKNLHRLIEAYRRLVQTGFDRHLVLVGRWGWDMDDLRQELRSPALAGRIHMTGYLSDEDLVHVYGGAEMFVYPSIEEGFGFPPLEAMAVGVPVIASGSSALGELYHEAAVTVNPVDIPEIVSAIRLLASDRELYKEKRRLGFRLARQFSWGLTARQIQETYLAAQNQVPPTSSG